MGVNLENRRIRRLQQQQPVSSWSRASGSSRIDHPVRIHTLGRFAVQIHHQPLGLTQARQQRPFDMLKALIALGGREVHAELLAQALWPDTDGDAAQNAFDVTLHRLRHLFDIKDLFILRDRRLTLNSNLAWVDAWAFERLVNHSERLLHLVGDPVIGRQVTRCSERLLNLYQGAFLEREASNPWTLTLSERLRSKLLRHMQDAGLAWEQDDNWEGAIRFYRKGLEVDPLTEELYQRLIIAYRATGRRAEAMRTFHRCRLILADQLQITPSQQTLELYHSLKA